MPLVSIVIPTGDRGRLLERSVRSACGQVDVDLEVVVVDLDVAGVLDHGRRGRRSGESDGLMGSTKIRRVLAIDPGTQYCGWAILEAKPGMSSAFRALGINTIVVPELPLLRRFGHLTRELRGIVRRAKEHGVDEAAIERPFVNRNHMATLAIAGARAIAAGLIVEAGLRIVDYPPQTWKLITGHGGADKIRVANVVKSLLHLDYDLPLDAADAGGIGIYHLSSRS